MKNTKTVERAQKATKPLRELDRALTEQIALGQELLTIANAQTEALQKYDAERVKRLEEQGQAVITAQEQAEARRVAAARALATALDMDTESASMHLSDLALRLPVTDARKLISRRSKILALSQAIHTANERNQCLLENALDYTRITLDAIASLAFQAPKYGSNPNGTGAPPLYIDHKA